MSLFILLASGCTNIEAPIDPEGGIWDRYFVYPLAWSLDYFAKLLNPSGDVAYDQYGWAIIIVTIILRLLTLPLMVKQIKSSRVMASLATRNAENQREISKRSAEIATGDNEAISKA